VKKYVPVGSPSFGSSVGAPVARPGLPHPPR
jgi:hypothetical protein